MIGSPASIFLLVGIACGFDELLPEATIVSNETSSAPFSMKNSSISFAICFSVNPIFI